MLLARDILLHTAPLILGAAKDIKAHIKIKIYESLYDLKIDQYGLEPASEVPSSPILSNIMAFQSL